MTRTPLSRSKVKVTGPLYSPPCWRVRRLQRWASERVGRGKLLLRCCLLSREGRFGANGGSGERRVHIVAAAHLQLVYINSVRGANRLCGEMSMGRNAHGVKCPSMGRSVHGRNVRGAKMSINPQRYFHKPCPSVYDDSIWHPADDIGHVGM